MESDLLKSLAALTPPKTNEKEINLCQNYEYLDHTADIQLHSWGKSLNEAVENCVIAMFGYMTMDLSTVEELYSMDFYASGSDLCSLVYNLLNTCLYHFSSEPFFIARRCTVLKLVDRKLESTREANSRATGDKYEEKFEEDDTNNYSIHFRAWGETFDLQKHPSGTEVKAITYSNLQVVAPRIDYPIDSFNSLVDNELAKQQKNAGELYEKHESDFNIFVIVDI